MKKIILSATAAMLVSANLFAASLEDEVAALKKEVAALKAGQSQINKNASDLSETVDKIETKSFTNKINFGGEISVRGDSFSNKTGDIGGASMTNAGFENYSRNSDPLVSARFRLNMKADVADNVKFVGSLEATRNSSTNDRMVVLKKSAAPTNYQDTVFEMARAYVDVKVNNTFSFDFGILPTAGGFSNHLAENKPRQSMFPGLMFDMSSYGAFGTANLDSLSSDMVVRAILAKAYTHSTDKYFYQVNRENVKNADIMGVFVEKKFGDTLTYVGVNKLGNFKASPLVSPTSITGTAGLDLGDIINYGAGVESSAIMGSGLTAFAHVAFSTTSGSGTVLDRSADIPYAKGEMIDGNGHAFHVGGQYKIGDTKLGLEYNKGSKYWFSGTQGAEDPFNKLATRGQAMEAYVIHNINPYVFAKLGALQIDEEYTGSGWHFGEPLSKDGKQTDFYLQLGANF